MKAFGVLLLLALNAFILCDVFLLSPQESLLFKLPVREKITAYVPALRQWLLPGTTAAPTVATPKPAATPAPVEAFVPPEIPSLDSLTSKWQVMPATAFPRQVKLNQPVTFQMGTGSSRLAAGAVVTALALDKGMLTLAPTQESAARAVLPPDQTDFKQQVAANYEEWKRQNLDAARRRWERGQAIREQAQAHASQLSADGRPRPDTGGAYPLLLASMNAGEVTEITPKKVTRWGRPELREVDGQPTWCINVDFKTVVYCGPIDATAQAQVRNGKVVAWIYPGSGEPVP